MRALRSQNRALQQRVRSGQGNLRWVTRFVLVGLIVAIAFFRGYTGSQLSRVMVAVLWAGTLPFILAGVSRLLKGRQGLKPWHRNLILALLGAVLLGTFAWGAKSLILST